MSPVYVAAKYCSHINGEQKMQKQDNQGKVSITTGVPWNKGKFIGPKPPLKV